MKKVRSLSKEKIDEISALIGASFWDYPYEPREGGLKPFFPSKAAMTEYMKSFVIAGIESGTFYSTDNGEGYILITDTKGNHPGFGSIIRMARRMKNALGGWGKLFSFLKQANSGCDKKPLEILMKKQYVKVEMLIVTEKYQGQGYMRKLMEFAYKIADKNGCPCILDTDAKGKCDRYVHLGMKLVQTRKAGGCKIYDLMYSKDGV
ncbi:GCN5 family acetyltransferase [Ruminococcus albus SY3]|uniref:GCN5 family acetyltransferase n=1 Tax=Ruminococcus albus SY3 TaxID=1341156 RepID=A0A011UG08_RUMAL|nr:GNAT family N-acetyltransferase [Ruminococcus albus]EXM39584.1 GCN5 family acetyltransferase [Ruminococcus albus SY3]